MDDLLIGRKEIMKEFGTGRWQTVLEWRKRYGFKFIRMPNGKPAILKGQLRAFILACDTERTPSVPIK